MNRITTMGCAAALLAASNAHSGIIDLDFSYTGSIETWTVAQSGKYSVYAEGAQGGDGRASTDSYVGGRGAGIYGEFDLLAGDMFYIAVGGMGSSLAGNYNGGGGGGSFFVASDNTPMLIAGGGGGIRAVSSANGCDASITQYGTTGSGFNSDGTGACQQKITDLGLGGQAPVSSWGSGGGGFFGAGINDSGFGLGGSDWINDLLAQVDYTYSSYCSGFGGFGGGGIGGCGGGSGGGGYSGGDGGFIAGGGGSFNSGSNQAAFAGVGLGNGSLSISLLSAATIESVPVPEPGTLALMGLGLLGMTRLRRKTK